MPSRKRGAGIRMHGRITDQQIEQIAQSIARTLRAHATGPLDEVASWIGAAEALGATVRGFYGQSGDGPGFYEATTCTIYYNLRADMPSRVRYLIHELAHHLLAQWPGNRFPRAALESYHDNRETVQHRVARKVEDLFCQTIYRTICDAG